MTSVQLFCILVSVSVMVKKRVPNTIKDLFPFHQEDFQPAAGKPAGLYKVLQRINYRNKLWPKGRIIKIRRNTAKKYLAEGKIIPVPKPKYRDALKLDFKLPETVVILGSGPKGKEAYNRISKDDFVISLNAAISAPIKSSLWMAMDPSLPKQDYFFNAMLLHYKKYYMAGYDMTENGIGKGYPLPIMEMNRIAKYFPWVCLTFKLLVGINRLYMMNRNDVKPIEGATRPGATIAGAVIQFCYWKGVKNIKLCGIDMFGHIYFDGSKHRKKSRKDSQWGVVPIFNTLMRHLESEGMKFTTLSDTRLEVDKE